MIMKILLARALYQDSTIFCLYNFFNLLDFEDWLPFYEVLVEQYLLFDTVFFYSNDLFLAKKADLILYFENGQIAEQGTFK